MRVGTGLRCDAPGIESDLDCPPVNRMPHPLQVAGLVDRFQIVERGGEWKPKLAGHLSRRQWAVHEEKAVDGVLVGPHPRAGHTIGQHPANSLAGDEEVEEKRNVGAARHLVALYAVATTPCHMPRIRGNLAAAMRPLVAALVPLVLAVSCVQPAATSTTTTTPAPADTQALSSVFGSYRADDGRVFVIARLGWFFDIRDATYRTIYAGAAPNRFTIGPAFAVPLPKYAELTFDGTTLTIATARATVSAQRVQYKQTDVTVPADGAMLAGAITEPIGGGPHPGIVIVHGSEQGERHFYDIWVGIYAGLGLTVLTYDKRGIGSSTGRYPGEFPTDESLRVYADDAAAALRFLSTWPGVDPKRVGFHGGSQGGWTVPLAIQRHGLASFAILVSAPATTVGQTNLWMDFSGGGSHAPTASVGEMEAAVRADHSGYDPAPALAALQVPTLWLLGSNDRTVPTHICAEILAGLNKPNFTVQMLPTGHGLLVNATGLNADDQRSPGLAPALVPTITDWLRAR
jgi:dienelactone hydrolase